jgi:hypothetical protein
MVQKKLLDIDWIASWIAICNSIIIIYNTRNTTYYSYLNIIYLIINYIYIII